jgi:hypothetical protein
MFITLNYALSYRASRRQTTKNGLLRLHPWLPFSASVVLVWLFVCLVVVTSSVLSANRIQSPRCRTTQVKERIGLAVGQDLAEDPLGSFVEASQSNLSSRIVPRSFDRDSLV